MAQPNEPLPNAGEVRILDTRNVPSVAPGRIGQPDLYVTYQDHAGNRKLVVVPGADPTDEEVRDAVLADAKKHSRWVNRTFPI